MPGYWLYLSCLVFGLLPCVSGLQTGLTEWVECAQGSPFFGLCSGVDALRENKPKTHPDAAGTLYSTSPLTLHTIYSFIYLLIFLCVVMVAESLISCAVWVKCGYLCPEVRYMCKLDSYACIRCCGMCMNGVCLCYFVPSAKCHIHPRQEPRRGVVFPLPNTRVASMAVKEQSRPLDQNKCPCQLFQCAGHD